ncbi:MAG: cobalamin-dependent protein [Alphaproteobacteria bacterium]|nr:cobalamin-dependent protein [Alphaproteobacteria bacterium]MCW5749542.1 cobalamin-dependent protein [Alphaproteobacteria bacterium]
MLVILFAVPAPGQCVKGESKFLGTVRTNMHKASLTALAASLRNMLTIDGLTDVHIKITDLQTAGSEKIRYGELRLGSNVVLEKYRVGADFWQANHDILDAEIVGISANYTHSRLIIADFLRHVRNVNKGALTVLGGTDATGDPEYYMRIGADVVVRGEGELSFHRLVKAKLMGESFESIPNIYYHDSNSGIIHRNKSTFLNSQTSFDVERLPVPALDLVDLSKYNDTGEGNPPYPFIRGPFISVETSRGCAQACSFCATPIAKGRFRFMSSEAIERHLKAFWAFGVRTLLFQEDNVLSRVHRARDGNSVFPDGRKATIEMFTMAYDMGFNWEFTNGLEFGQFEHKGEIDHELINVLFRHEISNGKARGCYRATMPLENLSDESSRLFRKLKPLGIVRDICEAVVASGVPALSFNLIIGRPQDDERTLALSYKRCQSIKETCLNINKNISIYFNVYVLSLLPGTVDFRNFKDLLAFDIERDPEVVTFYLGSLQTRYFSPLEITQARGTMATLLNGRALVENYDENYFLTSHRFERLFGKSYV